MSRTPSTPTAGLPGRDPRAHHVPAPAGPRLSGDKHVVVVGGGIAGLAAATALAERGARVTLLESSPTLGGRVAAWELGDGRTMSRGFHAFFRQYYNLRALLRRADPGLSRLVPVADYPLQRPDGLRDTFTGLPTVPPWSIIGFVKRSPTFTAASLAGVNIPAAMSLLRVRFPQTYHDLEGVSAAEFLDRLRFPPAARDLFLEVFARSFFADPHDFGAGELVAMFHTYFMGSAEGLLFDVPDDDYDRALWAPLGAHLAGLGVDVRTGVAVEQLALSPGGARVTHAQGSVDADAVVLATDPRAARDLVAGATVASGAGAASGPGAAASDAAWRADVAATYNAPPFAVLRLWYDGRVDAERPAFVGTSGYGPLDNVTVLERFEAGAAAWGRAHDGSVVELHAYACDPSVATDAGAAASLAERLVAELHRLYPETSRLTEVHRELLIRDDCTLLGPRGWGRRPGVRTPHAALALAGDWVRCDYPVALMERAATTGFQAANELLSGWGAGGVELWTPPLTGILRRG